MRRLAAASIAALLWWSGCESSSGRRVRVEITNVPAATTTLRAVITLENRHQDHEWSGSALDAVVAGSTEFTVGLDEGEKGPLEVRVTAFAETCTVAIQTASCLAVDAASCSTLQVALPEAMSCGPGGGDQDPDGGVDLGVPADFGVGDLWDGRCTDGSAC